MAQGTVKPRQSSKPATKLSRAGITKKGGRTIAPKKNNLRKQQKITKKLSAGLTAETEKMLGERAGHLEMLGSGRKKTAGDGGKAAKTGDPKKTGRKK